MWVLHAIVLICAGVPKKPSWRDHPFLKRQASPASSDQVPPASSKETVQLNPSPHLRSRSLTCGGGGTVAVVASVVDKKKQKSCLSCSWILRTKKPNRPDVTLSICDSCFIHSSDDTKKNKKKWGEAFWSAGFTAPWSHRRPSGCQV